MGDRATCPSCGETYDASMRFCPVDGVTLRSTVLTFKPGDVVAGVYRIERHVGGGAMSEVYEASQIRLERRVALKVASTPRRDSTGRVMREAEFLLHASHPNIVNVVDFGKLDDGRVYVALEWVDGETLEDRIRKHGPLDAEDALIVVERVAEALEAVHARGVLHRDLKPQNVLIPTNARGDNLEEVKLADFGVLGELVTERPGGERLTMAGVVVGTPAYMAPEQLAGEPNTPATDIYGLGGLLFAMLFGHSPFSETSMADFLEARLMREIKIPEEPWTPPAIRRLLARMLRRNARERFGSAGEALEAIRAARGTSASTREYAAPAARSMPTASAPPIGMRKMDVDEEQPLSVGRRPWLIAAGALVVLVLLPLLLLTPGGPPTGAVPGGQPSSSAEPLANLPLLALGLALLAGGIPLGMMVRRAVHAHGNLLADEASRIIHGSKKRGALTRTLAIEVEELIARCKDADVRILGITIMEMVNEFRTAKESPDRQQALMNVGQLMQLLMPRLSPWYVRHDKLIQVVASVVSIVLGIVTIMASTKEMLGGG